MITLSDLVPGAFKAQSPATLRRGWHSPPDFTRRDETPENVQGHTARDRPVWIPTQRTVGPSSVLGRGCENGVEGRRRFRKLLPVPLPGSRKVHSTVMGKPRQAGVENLDNGGPCRACGAEERPSQALSPVPWGPR